MPMPRLSPSMKHATILKWHISRFEEVQSYQLGLEILVNDLTNDSAAQHVMDIEILEDMYVAKIIGKEGETYTPGEPIALFCEKKSEVEEADNIDVSVIYFEIGECVHHHLLIFYLLMLYFSR
jgi:pyruvate/2-oxoglutarate dehydrogenase complex dihydrolipoamide acyltransferase (E2) component